MSSQISRCFETIDGSGRNTYYRSWPRPAGLGIRSDDLSIGIVFRGDPGYLKVANERGQDTIVVTPYATKATLRKAGVNAKFSISQTVEEFRTNGPDVNKISVEHNLSAADFNKVTHLLRMFAGWTNSSGSYYGRTSILT